MDWFQKQQNLGKLQSKKYDLEKKNLPRINYS